MSSNRETKFREPHKLLKHVEGERLKHGFSHRIRSAQSELRGPDAVFFGVMDLQEHVHAHQPTQDAVSYESRRQVTETRSAKSTGSARTGSRTRHAPYPITTAKAVSTEPNYPPSIIRHTTHIFAPQPTPATNCALNTFAVMPTTADDCHRSLIVGIAGAPRISNGSTFGKSQTNSIGLDRFQDGLALQRSVNHPIAPQQLSTIASSHSPWKIVATNASQGVAHKILPTPEYDGNMPEMGLPYPGYGNGDCGGKLSRNIHQRTPSSHPVGWSGVSILREEISTLQHPSNIAQTPYALSESSASTLNDLYESFETNWNQWTPVPLQTINAPPSDWHPVAESQSTVDINNFVQGGLPDDTYQQVDLSIPIPNYGISYDGQYRYPTVHPGTAWVPSSTTSASMMNCSGFVLDDECALSMDYSQNAGPYGPSLQDDYTWDISGYSSK